MTCRPTVSLFTPWIQSHAKKQKKTNGVMTEGLPFKMSPRYTVEACFGATSIVYVSLLRITDSEWAAMLALAEKWAVAKGLNWVHDLKAQRAGRNLLRMCWCNKGNPKSLPLLGNRFGYRNSLSCFSSNTGHNPYQGLFFPPVTIWEIFSSQIVTGGMGS